MQKHPPYLGEDVGYDDGDDWGHKKERPNLGNERSWWDDVTSVVLDGLAVTKKSFYLLDKDELFPGVRPFNF